MKKSKSVDNSALTYYESGFEKNRLRSNIGIIEFERTKEILLENLPTLYTQKSCSQNRELN